MAPAPATTSPCCRASATVEASELDPVARDLASERLGREVKEAALPDLSMFPADSYDLIALLDVLEHVPDDKGSLAAIIDRLKPGAALLLTVPANPWMWSAHDVAHHHHRRYRKGEIEQLARDAGYEIELLVAVQQPAVPADRRGPCARQADRQGRQRRRDAGRAGQQDARH